MFLRRPHLPLVLLLLTPLAWADGMKPGLWEMKQAAQLSPERQAQMEKAQKAMANMPAAQRQMMEQMMAQRGVSMNLGAGGGSISVKSCITPEQAARHQAPVGHEGRCTQDTKRDGAVVRTHFVCTDPASEGDATISFSSDEAFTTQVQVRRVSAAGKPETMNLQGEGRWLGADCGDVKPAGAGVKR
ncbi:DUF3617 domain-containing protein [Roseateles paludis]|jgi:hypothetical protein|uniref:DUF3617 domain-containing protein n=1 Tax=Roseateles paludis TaxID=3145238 RepID=A0ABV0G3U0_9BURK